MGEKLRTDLMEASEGFVKALEDISSDEIKKKDEYKKYIEALKQINKISNDLMKEEGDLGYPFVSKQQKKDLIEAYTICSKAIKSLKKELQNNEDKSSKAIISTSDSVMKLISKDVVTLNAYNPDKEEKTLPRLIKDARLYTFDVTGVDISTVGGNLSSRIPLSYTKPDGTVVKGMFTKKIVLDGSEAVETVINGIRESNRLGYYKFKEFLNDYFAAVREEHPNMTDKDIMSRMFYKGFVEVNGRNEYSFSELRDELQMTVTEYRGRKNGSYGSGSAEKSMAKRIVEAFQSNERFVRVYNNIRFAKREYEAENGGRVDSRNSAMSTVADLLGVGNVIARSVPAYIKNGDQLVEGTFMEYVDGVDVNNMTDDERKINPKVLDNSDGLKSVADLQILDYICGNIDRHGGNMLCIIDKKTKTFKGVKGIDNDASMGCYIPKDNKIGRNRFAPINSIRVMSESMAASIMALDGEVLQLALREYDLKPSEIDACCERLNLMKDWIDIVMHPENHKDAEYKPKFKIIKDEDFKLHKLNEFSKAYVNDATEPWSDKNLFGRLGRLFNKEAIKARPAYKETKLAEIYDKGLHISATSIKKKAQQAVEMVNLLNSKTEAKRTSNNYIALQEACEEYKAFASYLADKKGTLDVSNIEKMNSYLDDLVKAADKYLEGKGRLTGRKQYTQDRIDAALTVKKFAQKSKISTLNEKDLDVMLESQKEKETVAKENNRKQQKKVVK